MICCLYQKSFLNEYFEVFGKRRLLSAIKKENLPAIKNLVAQGVRFERWDMSHYGSRVAFNAVISTGNLNAYLLLKDGGVFNESCFQETQDPALHIAVKGRSIGILKDVIETCGNLNIAVPVNPNSNPISDTFLGISHGNQPGTTALHLLCRGSCHSYGPDIWEGLKDYMVRINLLLRAGANPNAENIDGETPIFYAAGIGGSLSIVRLLHDAGANLFHQDAYGRTVIFPADKMEVIKYLIRNGVNPSQKDKKGFSALDYAKISGVRAQKVEFLENLAVK